MSPTNPHVLFVFPKAMHTEETPDTGFVVEAFGPAPRSTCEAAVANLDLETTGFAVCELRELATVTASDLSKELDRQAAQRTKFAKDIGGFS